MSSILKLMSEITEEDKKIAENDQKHFAEENKKYEMMANSYSDCEDKMKKHVENIKNRLQQLINHKHSIHKALQEIDNLPGLPLPHEYHGNFIKFMSEIHTVLSNPDLINNQKEDLVNEIESTVISIAENIFHDLKKYKTKFIQAEALYSCTNELKKLNNIEDSEATALDDSLEANHIDLNSKDPS